MRYVPPALQAHLEQTVTTTCRLLKITLISGQEFGLTTLDNDITYQGVNYSSINGFDSSVIATDASYNIDNAEGYALLGSNITDITLDMVRRGELQGATWSMYIINWADLTMGHCLLDGGDLGQVKIVDGVVFAPELISYSMRLRQTVGGYWSTKCRAIFGSQTQGQLFCGVDTDPLWQNGEVTVISTTDQNRIFAADVSIPPPAIIEWTSGNNALSYEKFYQVDRIDADSNTIALFEPMPFSIEATDTFRIREECDKRFTTCRDTYGNKDEFKGEPNIPVGQASQVPRANIP